MLRDTRHAPVPARRDAGHDGVVVQQHQLAARGAELAVFQCLPRSRFAVRACEQQHDVGLPCAETRPGRVPRIRRVDDELVVCLDAMEPFARVRAAAHAPDEFRATGSPQRIDEIDRESGDVDVDAVGYEGDGAWPRVPGLQIRVREALHHEPGEAHDRGRMAQQDVRECLAAQPAEHGVAHRHDACSARPAGDHAHLADALAGAQPRERAGRAILRGHHAQGAGRDEVDRIRILAAVEQCRTTRQREPRDLGGDFLDDLRVQAVQQRQRTCGVQSVADRDDRRRVREIVRRIVS